MTKIDRKRMLTESLEPRCVLAPLFPAYIDGVLELGIPTGGRPYEFADTFKLESRPTSTKTIYLDFDGFHSVNNWWDHDIQFPAFNLNSDPTQFSNGELIEIQRQWQNVAEDFLPFDVNVTTKDPGVEALRKTSPNDEEFGIRVVATQATDGFGSGIGGIAFLFSFNADIDNPVFAFNKGATNGGMTISHEVGHALGLFHDGLGGQQYHPGAGSGETGWGPIMGAPFGRNVTQWSNGDYANSTNTEDDLAIIVDSVNEVLYRPDDYGSTRLTAEPLDVTNGDVFHWGVIERNTDVDYFSFETSGGEVEFEIYPFQLDPNLDIKATLYDSLGNVVAIADEQEIVRANFTENLAAGEYTLSIEGDGRDGRYDDYGSLGLYFIEFTLPSISGDFNGDGAWDIQDLDELSGEIVGGANNPTFDLNQDGFVTRSDLDQWLADAAAVNGLASPYLIGDANLDGSVDGSDFVEWNDNKFTNTSDWSKGDFTTNGVVDGEDFLEWNMTKFQASDQLVQVGSGQEVEESYETFDDLPFWPLVHDQHVAPGHEHRLTQHGHGHQHNGQQPCTCADCCADAAAAEMVAPLVIEDVSQEALFVDASDNVQTQSVDQPTAAEPTQLSAWKAKGSDLRSVRGPQQPAAKLFQLGRFPG